MPTTAGREEAGVLAAVAEVLQAALADKAWMLAPGEAAERQVQTAVVARALPVASGVLAAAAEVLQSAPADGALMLASREAAERQVQAVAAARAQLVALAPVEAAVAAEQPVAPRMRPGVPEVVA
jgi:hypothetical protein